MSTTPVRNVSGQDLEVPVLNRVVKAGEVVPVPDHLVESFLCQPPNWQAATQPSTKRKSTTAETRQETE